MHEPQRRRRFPFGWLMLVVLVAALAIPKLWPRIFPADADAEASPAPAVEEALTVTAVRLEPQRLAEVLTTTGSIRANERVELVSEIAGKVRGVHFEEGRPVHRGDLLLKIDDAELLAQRQRILAQLEVAEIREARQRTLFQEGILSQQEYDLEHGQLEVLRAELLLVETRLEKTEIRAPFDGIVGLRRVSEGTFLSPQTAIATLQDIDPVKVDFSLPEKYAGQVRPGGQVSFRTEASADSFRGTLYAVEPGVDPETRSLVLRARCPNPRGILLPGSFADVELEVRVVEDALAVPNIAVIPELGGKKVFVFEEGRAEARQVETGLRTESLVEVTQGLAPGDRVITSGLQQLSPGLAVEVAGDAEPDAGRPREAPGASGASQAPSQPSLAEASP